MSTGYERRHRGGCKGGIQCVCPDVPVMEGTFEPEGVFVPKENVTYTEMGLQRDKCSRGEHESGYQVPGFSGGQMGEYAEPVFICTACRSLYVPKT